MSRRERSALFLFALGMTAAAGCVEPTESRSAASLLPAIAKDRSPSKGDAFDFCMDSEDPVHLGNAAWLAFLSANEYSHAKAVAPILVDLGFENPDHPLDRAWPACFEDLDQLRTVQGVRAAQIKGTLGTPEMGPLALGLIPKAGPWGSCARPWFESSYKAYDTAPVAAFQRWLVHEPHPKSYLQFLSADGAAGSWFFKDASTQLLYARHKELPIVVLVFRGTEPSRSEDLMTDASIAQTSLDAHGFPEGWGKVHSGFQAAIESIEPLVMKKLEEVADGKVTIWVTGHSLGGALATLMTARLLRDMDAGAAYRLGGLYTFGSPRVGDGEFADSFTRAIDRHRAVAVRFRNGDDAVTAVPQWVAEYKHVGTLAHLHEGSIDIGGAEPGHDSLAVGDHDISGYGEGGTAKSGYYRRLLELRRSETYARYDRCAD